MYISLRKSMLKFYCQAPEWTQTESSWPQDDPRFHSGYSRIFIEILEFFMEL